MKLPLTSPSLYSTLDLGRAGGSAPWPDSARNLLPERDFRHMLAHAAAAGDRRPPGGGGSRGRGGRPLPAVCPSRRRRGHSSGQPGGARRPESPRQGRRGHTRVRSPTGHDLVVVDGVWRGYFPLSGDVLWNPDDVAAPYALIFDTARWAPTLFDPSRTSFPAAAPEASSTASPSPSSALTRSRPGARPAGLLILAPDGALAIVPLGLLPEPKRSADGGQESDNTDEKALPFSAAAPASTSGFSRNWTASTCPRCRACAGRSCTSCCASPTPSRRGAAPSTAGPATATAGARTATGPQQTRA